MLKLNGNISLALGSGVSKKAYLGNFLVYDKSGLPFIITMKTTTASESITMPIVGNTNNYSVDWGDGIITSGHTATATHVYAVAGEYDVKISGVYDYIAFNAVGDSLKVINIKQWGTNKWSSFFKAFYGCRNLTVSAIDVPNLTICKNLKQMFNGSYDTAPLFNINLNSWDFSTIENFTEMFTWNTNFNNGGVKPNWNTSSLINASFIFFRCYAFNHALDFMDISKVTNATNIIDTTAARQFTTENYDITLINWASQTVKSGVVAGFGLTKYTSASASARASLITRGWTITDGGMV